VINDALRSKACIFVLLSLPSLAASAGQVDGKPESIRHSARTYANTPALTNFLASLPNTEVPVFDEKQALALVALPLSCIDHPEGPPPNPNYLYVYETKPRLVDDYAKNRAFYGCYDWHSSVNSIWTMSAILRRFPQIPVGSLVREKLNDHLSKQAIDGEVNFFKTAKDFERPYGRAWILKLYADLLNWDDPEARKWTTSLSPLVDQFAADLSEYMKTLPFVTRAGVHGNTAFSMTMLLDYSEAVHDTALHDTVQKAAKQVFANDVDCPTMYEPSGADFLSPCLEEAKVMSRVLPQTEFVTWFDAFMPSPESAEFRPLTKPFDISGIKREDQMAGKSHLIGLAFDRAEAMLRIASVLSQNDPRATIYRRVAAINASQGFKDLAQAGYLGSHWLGTAALRYELARPQ
jgi:hypothetical protein